MDPRDRWLFAWGLGYTAVGAASLLVPLYAISIGGGPFLVGVIASTAALAGVPGALLWGWLVARTDRRRGFVLVALGATGAVLAVIPLTTSPWSLVALNALLWFVVSAASPVLTLLVIDAAPEPEWDHRIALLNAYQGYGWVGGLIAGSVWLPIGTRLLGPVEAARALFAVIALLAVAAVPLAVRWLPPEPKVSPERVTRTPELLARLARGGGRYVRTVPFATTRLYWGLRSLATGRSRPRGPLAVYLTAVLVFSIGFAAFWGPLPAYLRVWYADEQVFWLFLAANAASAVFYTRAGRLAVRQGAHTIQRRALAARVVLFPLVGAVVVVAPPGIELLLLLVVFGLVGLTWAVIAVTATGIVTRLGGDDRAGGLGLYTALAGIGGGIGSVAGGWLASVTGYQVAFLAAGAAVLMSLGMVGFGRIAGPGEPPDAVNPPASPPDPS